MFAARERGRWQGIIGAVFGIASVVGPLLGGFLTETHNILGLTTNWRWTLYLNVPIAIIAFLIIAIYCPALKHDKRPKVDFLGASLLTFCLATLILAIDNTDVIFADFISNTGINLVSLRVAMLSAVALAFVSFIVVENRAKEPILPMYFFRSFAPY